MPVYLCNRHGQQGAQLVCPHISEAIQDGKIVSHSLTNDIERLLGGVWHCDECKERWKTTANNAARFEEMADELKPVCGMCFTEWEQNSSANQK